MMCVAVLGHPLLPFPIATDPHSVQPPVPLSSSLDWKLTPYGAFWQLNTDVEEASRTTHFPRGQGEYYYDPY